MFVQVTKWKDNGLLLVVLFEQPMQWQMVGWDNRGNHVHLRTADGGYLGYPDWFNNDLKKKRRKNRKVYIQTINFELIS